ncbi:MAG TPA: hypothetical protein VJ720_11295, partial [Chitinophaga sp.]|nr:hypothetical protein [Chitinophaga sp.]
MNKRETYEIIIARKLEQLSVPAMEDAIWNRISTQLDIEMPENPQPENPQPEPPQPPRPENLFKLNSTLLKIASLSISAIAAIAIIIYLSLKYNTSTPQPAVPPV